MQDQAHHINSAVSVLLPFELERMIFELAVRERHSMGGGFVDILLVCNRVKEWIEAIIYESLIFHAPLLTTRLLLRTLASKTGRRQFFERTVKRVYLGPIISTEEAAFVLSICTGATEIVSWAPEIDTGPNGRGKVLLLDYLEHNSALERLAMRSNDIFGPRNTVDSCASYTSPLYTSRALHLAQRLSNITHLCIISPPEPTNLTTMEPGSKDVYPADYDALLYMSCLTHVVFGKLWARPHKALLPFFARMLSRDLKNSTKQEPSDSLQSLLLISSEAAFINHAKTWHERDAGSDCRLTFGKEYDYTNMARHGWIHQI